MSTSQSGRAREWIFISYRRADSGGYAQSVYKQLTARYGADAVFFDTVKIDIGVDFPQCLQDAVRAARAVIVVIGPDWLKSLNERADQPTVDYVREELRLTLARQQAGEALAIFPVLVGNAAAPDRLQLAGTLQAELSALTTINAHPLRPVPGWDDDFERLFCKIAPIRIALPAVYAAQCEVEERLRKEIVAVLDRPEMAAVRTVWSADPLHERHAADAHDLLLDFNNAIVAARKAWARSGSPLPPEQLLLVKEGCYEIVTLLYRLAVDIEAVRVWKASGGPAPVKHPGTAAVVAAVSAGSTARASPKSKGSTFVTDRMVDLGAGPDAGIGDDRLHQAFCEFWSIAYPEEETPAAERRDDSLSRLRIRMNNLVKRDKRQFGVTAVFRSDDSDAALRSLAEKLSVQAFSRTGQPGSLLRAEEDALADALYLCLVDIEKIL